MVNVENWDWVTPSKLVCDTERWKEQFRWVEDFEVSPDGEKIAAVVNLDEGEFSVRVNEETWEGPFEKAWHLRFSPDGRLTCIVMADMDWTVAVDGKPWENAFGYVMEVKFSVDGKNICAFIQQDGQYGTAVNGEPWEKMYMNMTDFAISADGLHTAGSAQIAPMSEGDIFTFQKGIFTGVMDGEPDPLADGLPVDPGLDRVDFPLGDIPQEQQCPQHEAK